MKNEPNIEVKMESTEEGKSKRKILDFINSFIRTPKETGKTIAIKSMFLLALSVLLLFASYWLFGYITYRIKAYQNMELWLFLILFFIFWIPILLFLLYKTKFINLKFFAESSKPKLVDYMCFGAVGLFCFFSFLHGDILQTSEHGLIFLEKLFSGRILQFYNSKTIRSAIPVYDLPTYLLFAVWNLPFYLFGVKSRSASRPYILMWNKLLVVIFFLLTAFIIYKILKLIGVKKDNAKWGGFLFLLTPFAVFSVLIMGQYDIIGTFFMALAVYFYLSKKYYKFSIFISIAIAFKSFFLFPVIPMILLIEKRPIHIIKYLFLSVSVFLFFKVLQLPFDTSNQMGFMNWMIGKYLDVGLVGAQAGLSFNIIALLIASVAAYRTTLLDDIDFYAKSMYIPLFLFSIFFIFSPWHPQWLVILSPFIVLTTFLSKNKKSALLTDGIAALSFLLMIPIAFVDNVSENMFGTLIFPNNFLNISNRQSRHNFKIIELYNVFERLGVLPEHLLTIFMTIFAACLFISLYIKFPTPNRNKEVAKMIKTEEPFFKRTNIWLYGLTIFAFIMPATFLALV